MAKRKRRVEENEQNSLKRHTQQMQIWLNETEKEQLYHELTAYFGLIGSTNE